MTIDLIHRHKIRIDLNGEELQSYHLSYDQLSAEDLQTRIMIGKLLSTAKETVGFDHQNKKLFVETYPHRDGGCVLYVSVRKDEGRGSNTKSSMLSFSPVIFTVKDLNRLCRFCACLQKQLADRIIHSCLYVQKNQYDLALVCTAVSTNTWHFLADEWDCPIAEGNGEFLRSQEHGNLLIPADAVGILAKC